MNIVFFVTAYKVQLKSDTISQRMVDTDCLNAFKTYPKSTHFPTPPPPLKESLSSIPGRSILFGQLSRLFLQHC